jgi:hypothetical protein
MKSEKIFIVGCTRTGKTSLSQILNKSGQVCIAEETQFLRRLSSIGRHKVMTKIGDMSDDRNAEQLVDYMYSGIQVPYWIWLKRNVDKEAFGQALLMTDRSEREIFLLLMKTYLEETRGIDETDIILGEETPTHIYYVPTLFEWFPETKIIHLFRDPRAIITAQMKQVQAGYDGLKVKFPSLPGWLLDPLVAPVELLRITNAWFDAAHLHSRYERLYPQGYHLLKFEDMISEPERQVKQVCEFLNIPYESAMLEDSTIVDPDIRNAVDREQEQVNPVVGAWFSILCWRQLKRFGYVWR